MNKMDQSFLAEYNADAAILKYSKDTAGKGINYLLEFEYGPIYLKAVSKQLATPLTGGARILEFGCGAAMNLIHCMNLLKRHGIPVTSAYGTDFSDRLITQARKEVVALPSPLSDQVSLFVARNESLGADLAAGLKANESELRGSFHFIFGVNTFRYPYRLGKARECAKNVYDLLKPGGICVVIDMNNKFPMFRTLLRDRLTRSAGEWYLPKLEEYAESFASVGFEILERRNFCWIPHSAGRLLLPFCRTMTPVLNALVPSFAMRSLVVSRKPA